MTEYKQKTFYVNMEEAKKMMDYLELQIKARSGTFDLKDRGKVDIKPYKGKIEFMCSCNEEIINELEKRSKTK